MIKRRIYALEQPKSLYMNKDRICGLEAPKSLYIVNLKTNTIMGTNTLIKILALTAFVFVITCFAFYFELEYYLFELVCAMEVTYFLYKNRKEDKIIKGIKEDV